MNPLTFRIEVRKFIGVINYYRNMWPIWSHTLAHLTRLTFIKRKFKWTQVKQYALDCYTCQLVLTARWDYRVIRTQLIRRDWEHKNEPSRYR